MTFIERVCIICGSLFSTTGAHDTCSDECDKELEDRQREEEKK